MEKCFFLCFLYSLDNTNNSLSPNELVNALDRLLTYKDSIPFQLHFFFEQGFPA